MDGQTSAKWLCHCLVMTADQADAAGLAQCSASDWDDIVQQALRHNVAPLLYKHFKALGQDVAIPAGVMQKLKDIYFRHAAAGMRRCHQLGQLLRAIRGDDIPTIVLKGTHLAPLVYGDMALRPMSDLDLLFRENDLPRVERKLLALGYTPHSGNNRAVHVHYHFHYDPPNHQNLAVEAHWRLLEPDAACSLDIAELWARARSAEISGVQALVLCAEDLLLYLCLHAAYVHRFEVGLGYAYDIAETIRCYQAEIDWHEFLRRACGWGAGKGIYLALRLAKELLSADVPGEVVDALSPGDFDASLLTLAEERILDTESLLPSLSSPHFVQFWQARRLYDKAAILLTRALPSGGVVAPGYSASLPSERIGFTYLEDWKDMFTKHISAAWRLWRGDEETLAVLERRTALLDWLSSP